MPGMNAMKVTTYVIDMTGPIRDAGFAADEVKVQLMPVAAIANAKSEASFQVGKVEILRV